MVEDFMTYADRAVALHFARGGWPEVNTMKEAARAKATEEQRREEAEAARKKIAGMAAEIAVLSEQLAEQSAANDKLQVEIEKLRAEFIGYWQRECQNSLPHKEPSHPPPTLVGAA